MSNFSIVAPQPLQDTSKKIYKIVGPDTAIYEYQRARNNRDFDRADKITALLKSNHMTPSFQGDKYEVHNHKRFLATDWSNEL